MNDSVALDHHFSRDLFAGFNLNDDISTSHLSANVKANKQNRTYTQEPSDRYTCRLGDAMDFYY